MCNSIEYAKYKSLTSKKMLRQASSLKNIALNEWTYSLKKTLSRVQQKMTKFQLLSVVKEITKFFAITTSITQAVTITNWFKMSEKCTTFCNICNRK